MCICEEEVSVSKSAMSTRCTTHFNACDCREERFKELEAQNKILKSACWFYADELNWGETYNNDLGRIVFMGLSNDTEILGNDDYYVGGKLAREALKQIGEMA